VEVTLVQDGFGLAWEEGAREWRRYAEADQAQLYPVADAWERYEGVGLPDTGLSVPAPAADDIVGAFDEEIRWFVRSEVEPRIAMIRERYPDWQQSARALNSIGVTYARFDLLADARVEFERALEVDALYLPALVNIGNVLLLAGDAEAALENFLRARDVEPMGATVLLGLTRAFFELEEYRLSSECFLDLQRLHPEVAAEYSYLDRDSGTRTRAADAQRQRELVDWEDEP
jgi:tetratricopeptide (TPR) repeat protein